jgi:hypothetical protein
MWNKNLVDILFCVVIASLAVLSMCRRTLGVGACCFAYPRVFMLKEAAP